MFKATFWFIFIIFSVVWFFYIVYNSIDLANYLRVIIKETLNLSSYRPAEMISITIIFLIAIGPFFLTSFFNKEENDEN